MDHQHRNAAGLAGHPEGDPAAGHSYKTIVGERLSVRTASEGEERDGRQQDPGRNQIHVTLPLGTTLNCTTGMSVELPDVGAIGYQAMLAKSPLPARDQDVARASRSGWSWLKLSQPGGKIEQLMGIETT
jgi:hypothetical protein